MPAVPISTSPNITSLDSKIVVDLELGNFYVDLSPSVYLPGGASAVLGASVQITNPVGVIFKPYPTVSYDILPPMTSIVTVGIPIIASNYQYGTYLVEVKLTDADSNSWTVSKSVNICPPDPDNKNKKTGCLNATITGNCQTGKVIVSLNQPPNYKGTIFTSQINDLELEYPTGSGLPVLATTHGSFSVALFEGKYILTGTASVLYYYGDNVYFRVLYKVHCEKPIKCILDECCIQDNLDALYYTLTTDCTDDERAKTESKIVKVVTLIQLAKGAANCGADPSSFITELEKILGCVCTCNCNEGTPIINNAPVTDFVFEGCGFEEDTVGLTKVITIYNYGYKVVLSENSDPGLTLSEPVLNAGNCEKVQTLEYTAPTSAPQSYVYRGLLTQSGTGAPTAVVDSANTVTIVWTRLSPGVYLGTLTFIIGAGSLTLNNTFPIISPSLSNSDLAALYASSTTVRVLSSVVDAGIPTDGLLSSTPFQLSILS